MWPFRKSPAHEPEPSRCPSSEQIQGVQSNLNLHSDSGGMSWIFTGSESQYSGKIHGIYSDGRVARWRWTLNNRQLLPHQNYTESIDEALYQISRQIAIELIDRSQARAYMRAQAEAIDSSVNQYLEKRRADAARAKEGALFSQRDPKPDPKPDGSHGFYG